MKHKSLVLIDEEDGREVASESREFKSKSLYALKKAVENGLMGKDDAIKRIEVT